MASIKVLEQLQACDTEYIRAQKELESLPEAKQIMEYRAKRKEIKGKQDQVVELSDDVEAKIAKLQREEEQVIAKINELQAKLDSSSDYRVTQSVTKEMNGQVKRQASIADEQNELLERQIKIDKLADQVADMLAKVDHGEHHVTEEFKRKGTAIKEHMDQLAAERTALIVQLDGETASRYEQIREEKGGIALAFLDGDHCSVCSTVILTGQLYQLQHGPALAECPNCHRLMIVRQDEDGEE